MKEFKVVIKTLECVTVQAESAGAALELVKKNIDDFVNKLDGLFSKYSRFINNLRNHSQIALAFLR